MKQVRPSGFSYAFQQQMLKAWQPLPTLTCAVIVFTFFGCFFLLFGILMLVFTTQTFEGRFRYDNLCEINTLCSLTVNITANLTSPIFVYYELTSLYQNHRRYLKSKSVNQLKGGAYLPAEELTDCDPVVYNRDVFKTFSVTGEFLDPDQPAFPCGLIARSVFNDSYSLLYDFNPIFLDETGIAYPADIKYKYKNLPDDQYYLQWLDVENEHFMVWMRNAATPNFRKLWAHIDQDLPTGLYQLNIINNYDTSIYGGKKYFVMATTNRFGGKNYFLSITFIVVGVCSLGIAVLLLVRKLTRPKRYYDIKQK